MTMFIAICAIHFIEHLAQLYQLFVLNWQRFDCLGLLGLWQPNLVRSEWLHYLFVLYMLIGVYYFRSRLDRAWGQTTIYLLHFHHIEHLLLLSQALLGFKPTGIGGIWFPRIELHFFYNAVVFIAMIISIKKYRGVSL